MRVRIESKILTLSLGICIFWMATGNPCFGKLPDNRVYVARVLQANHLKLSKDSQPTAFVFQFEQGDSLRIECADCQTRIKNSDGKGIVAFTLATAAQKLILKPEMLGKWLPVNSENGKLGLLFERNGMGERVLSIQSVIVTRKSRTSVADVAGVPHGLLEVSNFYLDGHGKLDEGAKSTFFFKMRPDDMVKLEIVGIDYPSTNGVGCYLFRDGEEFAKRPLMAGVATPTSGGTSNLDLYGIEFAHNKDVKQGQHYHLSVARIPAANPKTSSTKGK
jgi:hypothetical protein